MKIRLVEIAEAIFTGLSTSGRAPVGKGDAVIPILNVKDLTDGEIDASSLNTVRVEHQSKIQRYSVQANDVLITVRGTLLKTAVVPESLAGCIISSNLAAIRLLPHAPMVPVLLQAYLESSIGQQAVLARAGSRAAQLAITARDLGEVMIPIPDLARQRQLEELVIATRQYVRFEKQALEARIRVSQHLVKEAFSGL